MLSVKFMYSIGVLTLYVDLCIPYFYCFCLIYLYPPIFIVLSRFMQGLGNSLLMVVFEPILVV
jgi:hypothetical protein